MATTIAIINANSNNPKNPHARRKHDHRNHDRPRRLLAGMTLLNGLIGQ